MKIQVIIPASDPRFLEEHRAARIAAAGGVAEVEVSNLPDGPASIETSEDEAQAVPPLIKAARAAEAAGFDGITVDCAADPGLRAVKEAVSIPVCAAGEASYLTALAVCERFSVIAVVENTALIIRDNLRRYGLANRVVSVRAAGVPVLELRNADKALEALEAAGRSALKEGAGAIVLGCTGMAHMTGHLERRLGVPVIEPAAAAVRLLIALIGGKLSISKKDFPSK